MTKFIHFAFASGAALALASCGSSQDANQEATADTVEMPAEEAMTDITGMPSETPADMPTAMTSDVAAPVAMASEPAASATPESGKSR